MAKRPRRAYAPKPSFHRTLIAVDRGQGRINFFLVYFTFQEILRPNFFSKIDGHFFGTSCFVIANLGRLAAAKMRLSINCIIFAYARLIDYPQSCLHWSSKCKTASRSASCIWVCEPFLLSWTHKLEQ